MTDEELIAQLRKDAAYWSDTDPYQAGRYRQASDRIETLIAEKEGLASVATDFASSLIVAENNLSHVSEENERLREGLNAIIDRGVERDQKWMGMNARDIARTALEKQP
jgi:hypothetical protein